MSVRIGSLCSGVGMLDLAVMDALGGTVAWHAQYDPDDKHQYAAQILDHRFPGVPNHGDITTIDWTAVEPVDVLTAGWPCQDMSLAGLGAGLMPGTRSGLWYHVAAAIAALRPPIVILENVRSLTSAKAHSNMELCAWCLGDIGDEPALRALGAVLGDLADIGFDAEWLCLPASDVGAPHQRWRAFVLAWPAADANGFFPGDDGELPAGRNALRQRVRDDAAGRGAAIADAEGDGRYQGRPEPAGIERRPDAALGGGHAAADAEGVAEREPADGTHPVTGGREARPEPGDRGMPDRERERERGRRRDQAAADSPHHGRQRERDPRDRRTGPADHDQNPDIDWGPYTAAIRRWERVMDRTAPAPTETGKNGPRLSPALPEWMMGLPAGWVTDVPGIPRNAQLHALGNGVVRQQGTAAIRILAERVGLSP